MEAWKKNVIMMVWQLFGFAIGFLDDGLMTGLLTMTAMAMIEYLNAMINDYHYVGKMHVAAVYTSIWIVLIDILRLTNASMSLKVILTITFSIVLAFALVYHMEKAADDYEDIIPTSLSFGELQWIMMPFGIGVAAGIVLGIVYQLRKRDRAATN